VDFKGKAKVYAAPTLSWLDPDPYSNAGVGEAVDFPEFPGAQAAGAEGPRPVEGHPRSDRHGQLPRREEGGYEYRTAGRRRRDRAGADDGGGHKPEPELDYLSNIIRAFNEQFGNIQWKDSDKIQQVIAEEIPTKVAADKAYQNAMKNSDKQNARIEHDKALERVVVDLLTDHTELFKQFMDNQSFRKWLGDTN
jgi:hypothetical protein